MKSKWRGVLVGGILGLLIGIVLSLVDSRLAIFNSLLGNNLYILFSQGGGIAGYFRFIIYFLLLCFLVGILIGYLISKRNEKQ